jgi:acyl carrier protein
MTRDSVLRKLEAIMEIEPGTLKGDERLADLEAWDSLKVMEFLAFADGEFSMAVPPKAVGACKTVGDLVGLLGNHIA